MIRPDCKTWVQTERSSVLTCCHTDLWLRCGSHLIIVIGNNLTSTSSPGKRVSCLFQLGCQFVHSIVSLAASSCLSAFPWVSSATTHKVQPTCLTTIRPIFPKRTRAWWSPSAFLAFFGFLQPLLTQSSLPTWPPWKLSDLSGLKPGSPLSCLWPLLMQSSLPAWLSWEPSDLSGLSPDGPPWFHSVFPLSSPWVPLELSFLTMDSACILFYSILFHFLHYYFLLLHYYCPSILIIVFLTLVIYSRSFAPETCSSISAKLRVFNHTIKKPCLPS